MLDIKNENKIIKKIKNYLTKIINSYDYVLYFLHKITKDNIL